MPDIQSSSNRLRRDVSDHRHARVWAGAKLAVGFDRSALKAAAMPKDASKNGKFKALQVIATKQHARGDQAAKLAAAKGVSGREFAGRGLRAAPLLLPEGGILLSPPFASCWRLFAASIPTGAPQAEHKRARRLSGLLPVGPAGPPTGHFECNRDISTVMMAPSNSCYPAVILWGTVSYARRIHHRQGTAACNQYRLGSRNVCRSKSAPREVER